MGWNQFPKKSASLDRFPSPTFWFVGKRVGTRGWVRELRRRGKTDGHVFTMHQDALPTHVSLFPTLLELLAPTVAVVGVRRQRAHGSSPQVVHPLGALWRYSTLDSLGVGLIPTMPAFDVGEKAVAVAQEQGWKIESLSNSFSDPHIEDKLGLSPWDGPRWDRVYGRDGNLCFLHLGRGIQRSTGGGALAGLHEWVDFVEGVLET